MLLGGTAYYTSEDYVRHLEHLVHLLEKHENFHVHIVKEETENQYMVYARKILVQLSPRHLCLSNFGH
jgi:hypothetical protein